MKKKFCFITVVLLFSFTIVLQLKIHGNPKEIKRSSILLTDTINKYPVAIKFQSVCCGVPSDAPLQKAIKSFKNKNKLSIIKAVHIGPLGREGEYALAFPLNEMNISQKKAFLKMLKTTVKKLTNKGKASIELNASYDPASLPSRVQFDRVGF